MPAWLLFLLLCLPQAQAAPAARDVRPASASGTATISGRITDKESGRPIPTATVSVKGPDGKVVTVRADADGRYTVAGLQPGSYALWGSPGEYRETHLRQAFGRPAPMNPFVQSPDPNLTLQPGEARSELDIALVRTLAIEGRVVDPFDEPMAGVEVTISRADSGSTPASSVSSDDHGEYRLFGLAPGRYHVCAAAEGPFDNNDPAGSRFVRTCHLASIAAADAADVVLDSTDVSGIDIRVQRSGTFRLSGVVLDASGAPPKGGMVTAMRLDESISANAETRDGRFELKGIPPGRYLVRASVGRREMTSEGAPVVRDLELAEAVIAVDSNDVGNLTLTTVKATSLSGRIAFEGGAPGSPAQLRMAMQLVRRAQGSAFTSQPPMSAVDDRLEFHLEGVYPFPSTLLVQGLPEGWVVKSIRLGDSDITGLAADYSAGAPGPVLVVLTNRVARPSVRVIQDPAGSVSGMPILMSANPQRRLASLVGTDTPTGNGVFKLGSTLPGEYLLVALTAEDLFLLYRDLDRLEDLVPLAQRVTLAEGKEQTFEVPVVALPPRR
jgi:protocatechuate 3,4-dioxygenase beta subunit